MKPVTYFFLWLGIFVVQFICLWYIGVNYGAKNVSATFLFFAVVSTVLFALADILKVVKNDN